MNIKITERKPSGVLLDLEGSEVKSGGKTTLSLSDDQFAALVGVLNGHLARVRPQREPKAKPKPIDKGRHP